MDYAEYESEGGVKHGDVIRSHFGLMEDEKNYAGRRALAWHIHELIDEAGV